MSSDADGDKQPNSTASNIMQRLYKLCCLAEQSSPQKDEAEYDGNGEAETAKKKQYRSKDELNKEAVDFLCESNFHRRYV